MINLCRYKNIFGKPREGVHSYRIFNIAIVDLTLTLLVAYLLARYYKCSFVLMSIALLLLGTIIHKIMCVDTTITKMVFN